MPPLVLVISGSLVVRCLVLGRGFPGVGDLGVRVIPDVGDLEIRGVPDVGDLGVGGSLMLETTVSPCCPTLPCGPHTETASQTGPSWQYSALDVVWTCGDTMTSLQAPGAHCLLWISPRLFLVLQACGEPPIFTVLSRGLSEILMNTNHQPALNLVNFPSLFLIFLLIEMISSHTRVWLMLSMSFPSTEIRMSNIHTFVTGTSLLLLPHDERVFIIHLHCLLPESEVIYQQLVSGGSGERIHVPQSSYFLGPYYRFRPAHFFRC